METLWLVAADAAIEAGVGEPGRVEKLNFWRSMTTSADTFERICPGALTTTKRSILAAVAGYLRADIHLRDIEPRFQPVTAFNRFSVRS
jgi:hypothetical protein